MSVHTLWDKMPYVFKSKITNSRIFKAYMVCYRKYMKRIVLKVLRSDESDKEKQEIAIWLKKNPLTIFPYNFTKAYIPEKIQVFEDGKFLYVKRNNKNGRECRIYAPESWSEHDVQGYFSNLFMEQDKDSPHAYFQDRSRLDWKYGGGYYAADFGGAEGIFTLDIIDEAKKVYIFESDKQWIKPLQKTFELWPGKVEIIQKFVGNEDNETTVRMDSFFRNKRIDCIKADIEGAERNMLLGGKDCLENKIQYIFIASYHKNEDDRIIAKFLQNYGFHVVSNRGYMIPWMWPYHFKPPYVRRGIIYGEKSRELISEI